jgi:hypothetical protein
MAEEDIDISTVDDVSDVAHTHNDQRKLSDFKPTNTPLSADEIERAKNRDRKDASDLKPLPETDPAKPREK